MAARPYKYNEPKRTLYTLKRYDAFSVKLYGPNHCSTKPAGSTVILRYRLIIQCFQLDNQKSVYEQESLAEWFDAIGSTGLSCEALAEQAAKAIHRLVAQLIQSNQLTVEVSISPPPYIGSAAAFVGSL